MAKIIFGNVIVDMRGKVSGNVYAKNKGGAYCRVRVVPSNPQSVDQSSIRGDFTANSQAWKSLTENERQSWRQGSSQFPKINNLGMSHNISGNSLFIGFNRNLNDVGIAPITECPSPDAVEVIGTITAVANTTLQTLVLTMGQIVPANTALKVSATPSLSAGINSVGSRLRKITFLATGTGAAPLLTVPYLAKFGAIGAVGDKIFLEITPVNITTGQTGSKNMIQVIITA